MLNTPYQFDGNLKITLKDAYWIGTSYRHQDAVADYGRIEIGNIMFGYTYDIESQILKPTTMGRTKFFRHEA